MAHDQPVFNNTSMGQNDTGEARIIRTDDSGNLRVSGFGSQSDLQTTNPTSSGSLISFIKGILSRLNTLVDFIIISGSIVGSDRVVQFNAGAVVNTIVSVDIVKPLNVKRNYILTVYNPSSESELSLKIQNVALNFGGQNRFSDIRGLNFSIPKNSCQTIMLQGIFISGDCRLVFSNDQSITSQVICNVRIREV